ncbi:response regulator [Sulfurimonas sp.]|uniref:response regulator n=1 Tax=Sulfurimonas sp. TaxID=2022749 RepID=UPI0035642F48
MLDTDAVLKYSKNLSSLYFCTDKDTKSSDVLQSFFKEVIESSDRANDLKIYISYKEQYGNYVDVVILDFFVGVELCNYILKINPNQKIILSAKEYTTDNLSGFIEAGVTNFTSKPISAPSLSENIYDMSRQRQQDNLLKKYVSDYKTLKKEKDLLAAEYDKKLADMKSELEEKGTFLASMSHEIRTPMNAIIGFSEIMLNEHELSSQQLDYTGKINRSSKMLLSIINDILDYSKIEAGKLKLENIEFDINMVLDHVADMIGLKAQEKGLDLVFDIDYNVGSHFFGDPLRISQVLINLLSNAVKFTDKGSITLKVSKNDDAKKNTIEFKVSDTGIGLKEEQMKRLFQHYSQAEESISRKYGGTGLGLMITKQLVELMNGRIWVKSEYTKGTTFYVRITLDVCEHDQRRTYHLPSKELMKKRVLIIDSRVKSAISLSHMLEYYHMPVQYVNSIEEAKVLLLDSTFDIVFIDEKSNIESNVEIFTKEPTPKIVLVQERIYQSHMNNFGSAKIDTYLTKPFNQQMVFNAILRLYNYDNETVLEQKKSYKKDDLKALGKKRILLAEDNKINQRVMQGVLAKTELELVLANDGQEAVEMIKTERFDMVLMDVQMPVMDGHEATREIRKNSEYDSIPIIAMTAEVMPEEIQKAKDNGMQDHLPKPIDISSLCNIMFKYLDNKKETIDEIDSNSDCHTEAYRLCEVPELNYKSTLRRMGNDACMYNSLIVDFIMQYKDSAQKIALYIKDNNFSLGAQYTHDIRVAASNIGAKTIFKESKALEYAFIRKELSLLQKQLQKYNKAMEKFINLIENATDMKYSQDDMFSGEIINDLSKLLKAVKRKHIVEIISITEELRHKKWPKAYNRNIYQIIRSTKQYHFEKVVTQLQAIGIK